MGVLVSIAAPVECGMGGGFSPCRLPPLDPPVTTADEIWNLESVKWYGFDVDQLTYTYQKLSGPFVHSFVGER